MIVPDINLLIYAYNVDAPASDAAQDWWQKLLSGTATVGVPWAVATGFVRIISNPRIMNSPLPLETAAFYTPPAGRTNHPPVAGRVAPHFGLLTLSGTAKFLRSRATEPVSGPERGPGGFGQFEAVSVALSA